MSNVLTICGSLRKGSYNHMLANLLPGLAPAGMTIKASPSIEMPLYNSDVQAQGFPPAATALAEAIRAADGVIIVSPEYNWTIPGGLKNAIDWVSRVKDQPFVNKPIALQSCSMGILGGARMQYHMRQSMVFLDAYRPQQAGSPRGRRAEQVRRQDRRTEGRGDRHDRQAAA